jgi:aryl-alcohol dehydrogenase-like predicted oxidoreductase
MIRTSPDSLRTLGGSDLKLSAIGFGAWAIGGGEWQSSWGGPQDDNDSVNAIHRALDMGINWIDAAPIYGLGHSEEIVARAVKSSSRKPYIFTKCGRRSSNSGSFYDSLKAASIFEEVDSSLRRLGTETIDLYQIHWPNPDEEIEEGWETLRRIHQQGKVRWIGVSNFSVEQMKRVEQIAPITRLQPPYSMLRRAVEAEILPFAQANDIGVINYSPMLSGLLTGTMTAERIAALPAHDWRRKKIEFNEPRLRHNMRLVELLREIGNDHSVIPGVVAVAWTLHHPAITATIVGGRNVNQVTEMVCALHFRLTEEEYARISDFLATIQI